ncbi:MAG: hypothetical protein QOF85_2088, partial [Solirubrobacterales bacterium]|nr:hypothetical protein [Solirubrobacterales bacterium]
MPSGDTVVLTTVTPEDTESGGGGTSAA